MDGLAIPKLPNLIGNVRRSRVANVIESIRSGKRIKKLHYFFQWFEQVDNIWNNSCGVINPFAPEAMCKSNIGCMRLCKSKCRLSLDGIYPFRHCLCDIPLDKGLCSNCCS